MQSITIQSKNLDGLNKKIHDAVENGFTPTLAICFVTYNTDFSNLTAILKQYGAEVFGTSSYAEIIDNRIETDSITVMLLNIKPEDFCIYSQEFIDDNAFETSIAAGEFAKSKFDNPAFILAYSSFTVDGLAIIQGLQQTTSPTVPIFGGIASNNISQQKSCVFSSDKIHPEGAVFLILNNDKIEVNGIASSGWEEAGVARTVTKADETIVHEIDNQPALEFINDYLNFEKHNPIKLEDATRYPLMLLQNGRPSVLRTVLHSNLKERSVTFACAIPEGSQIKFTVKPSKEIVNKTVSDVINLYTTNREADCIIMFSCLGRHLVFGKFIEEEIECIYDIWNTPMAGFFSYGEIGGTNGVSEFHNETCSLLLLKER